MDAVAYENGSSNVAAFATRYTHRQERGKADAKCVRHHCMDERVWCPFQTGEYPMQKLPLLAALALTGSIAALGNAHAAGQTPANGTGVQAAAAATTGNTAKVVASEEQNDGEQADGEQADGGSDGEQNDAEQADGAQ
jgi:hypothetical protein